MAELRHEAGLSQEELANRCGLHRTYVGAVERGERNPTLISMLAICRGLGIKLSALLKTIE